jgi:hypothetical protein
VFAKIKQSIIIVITEVSESSPLVYQTAFFSLTNFPDALLDSFFIRDDLTLKGALPFSRGKRVVLFKPFSCPGNPYYKVTIKILIQYVN